MTAIAPPAPPAPLQWSAVPTVRDNAPTTAISTAISTAPAAAAGPIALLGGGEHRQGTAAIEAALLDHLGVVKPRVLVVPAASPRRIVGMVAALARNHWTRLGATVRIALPGGDDPGRLIAGVRAADVIVLTGGVPNRLVGALGASPVWDEIVQRWRDGAAISASSAGAMSLFAWRLRLYPPNPLELIPGLGPFDGWVAAPHFDRFRAERWGVRAARHLGDLGVLGLDEGTALIQHGDRSHVVGAGAVTFVRDGRMRVHPAGEALAVDLGGGAPSGRSDGAQVPVADVA